MALCANHQSQYTAWLNHQAPYRDWITIDRTPEANTRISQDTYHQRATEQRQLKQQQLAGIKTDCQTQCGKAHK